MGCCCYLLIHYGKAGDVNLFLAWLAASFNKLMVLRIRAVLQQQQLDMGLWDSIRNEIYAGTEFYCIGTCKLSDTAQPLC
jgi:hypothetical protein